MLSLRTRRRATGEWWYGGDGVSLTRDGQHGDAREEHRRVCVSRGDLLDALIGVFVYICSVSRG